MHHKTLFLISISLYLQILWECYGTDFRLHLPQDKTDLNAWWKFWNVVV